MNIAITGSHGFVGSHLARAIEREPQHTLVRFDRRVHSLTSVPSLRSFLVGQDIIFHLAGANRGSSYELMDVNTLGTLNLLEAMRKFAQGSRLVFLSSLQVYKPSADKRLIGAKRFPAPATIYGISKRAAEDLIINSGISSIIFRASNIYGPGCRPYYNSVISTFIHQAIEGKTLTLNGSGEQCRDFIYVQDIVTAFIKVLAFDWQGTRIYDLCYGRLTSINEVVRILDKLAEKPISLVRRPGDDEEGCLLGDNSKARQELSWVPEVELAQGLRETYKWLLASR